MLSRILMTLVLAGLTAVAGAETIYKWIDSSGQIHYTDLPPRQADAKLLGVFDREVNELTEEEGGVEGYEGDEGSAGDDSASESTPPPESVEPSISPEALAAARDDAERMRVERCKLAKDRYQAYIEARRLFREQDGRRVYLTDAELTAARARAKQSVDDYCS